MFCGVVEDELMVRVGPDFYGEALSRPNVRPMDFTGRPMKGYIFVVAEGCRTARMTKPWVDRSLAFVKTLEPTKRWRTNRQRATKELRNPNPKDPEA
jgi:TfoX N-terminal domain